MPGVDRLVIYRLGSLGDTVAALPCFHLIERAFPRSERIVLTNFPVSSKAAPLELILRDGGFVDRSIRYPIGTRDPREFARLIRVLRAEQAHTLVYLADRRGLRAAWRDVAFFRMCGFTNIVGAPLTKDLQRNRRDEFGNLERESSRLARTLHRLGPIDLEDRGSWDLKLTAEEHSVAAHRLAETRLRRFIAVNTGGKTSAKDLGIAAWSSLIGSLAHHFTDWDLVFIGGLEDRDRAAQLGASWHTGVVDLCGRLSPRESAAALSRASLFIGHDSGALHLADAVGIPAIGLFGDYNRPNMWHPPGEQTRVIHHMTGLSTITPGEVLEVALELIGSRPNPVSAARTA